MTIGQYQLHTYDYYLPVTAGAWEGLYGYLCGSPTVMKNTKKVELLRLEINQDRKGNVWTQPFTVRVGVAEIPIGTPTNTGATPIPLSLSDPNTIGATYSPQAVWYWEDTPPAYLSIPEGSWSRIVRVGSDFVHTFGEESRIVARAPQDPATNVTVLGIQVKWDASSYRPGTISMNIHWQESR